MGGAGVKKFSVYLAILTAVVFLVGFGLMASVCVRDANAGHPIASVIAALFAEGNGAVYVSGLILVIISVVMMLVGLIEKQQPMKKTAILILSFGTLAFILSVAGLIIHDSWETAGETMEKWLDNSLRAYLGRICVVSARYLLLPGMMCVLSVMIGGVILQIRKRKSDASATEI